MTDLIHALSGISWPGALALSAIVLSAAVVAIVVLLKLL